MSADGVPRSAGATVFAWQRAAWLRVSPGRVGTGLLAGLVLLPFLPLGSLGLFQSWTQGSVAVASLGALFLAVGVGRETASPRPEELWIYQKGISLADWGLNRWLADAVMAAGMVAWWTVWWAAAAAFHGEPLGAGAVVAIAAWLLIVYLLASSLLFLIGAAGSRRGSELVFVLFLAALMAPVLVRGLPEPAARAVSLLLPPLQAGASLRGGIAAGESLRVLAPPFLHVTGFVAVAIGIGAWLLSRRRPLL